MQENYKFPTKFLPWIDPSWYPFFNDIYSYINRCYEENQNENWEMILRIFKMPRDKVKVVIFSYYSYPKFEHNNELAFSSSEVMPLLLTISQKLKREYPTFKIPNSGDLSHWVEQGVFLPDLIWEINGKTIIDWHPVISNLSLFLGEDIIYLL